MRIMDMLIVGGAIILALSLREQPAGGAPPATYVPDYYLDDFPPGPAAGDSGGGGDSYIEEHLPPGVLPEAGDWRTSWMDRSAEEWAYKAAYGVFPLPQELLDAME
jgi:hypothetical protein